jgi:hypothetical protein
MSVTRSVRQIHNQADERSMAALAPQVNASTASLSFAVSLSR